MDEIDILKQLKEVSDKLTYEEWAFCERYLKDMNMSVFDLVDGVFPELETGEQKKEKLKSVLNNPHVREYLDLKREFLCQTFISKHDILLKARRALDKCDKVAELDKFGHPTGKTHYDAKSAVKILDLMFKHLDLGQERATTNTIPYALLPNDDLDKLVDKFNAEY